MGNEYDRALEEKGHKEPKPEKEPAKPGKVEKHKPDQHPKFEREEE